MKEISPDRLNRQIEIITNHFGLHVGGEPEAISIAPGRVNLIGEHTDYNEGFVLPMAIDFHTTVAFRRRSDRIVRAVATDLHESGSFSLDEKRLPKQRWLTYIAATVFTLLDDGHNLGGLDMVVHSNVPIGAGLSSSAALEMAVARALSESYRIPWQPVEMAFRGQYAENHYVGVQCGIMDQYAVACAQENSAILLDCRSFESRQVQLPENLAIVIMDSGIRRSLSFSAYNERRAQCQTAVSALAQEYGAITALRDASTEMLDAIRSDLNPTVYRRARFVVEEIRRPLAFRDAIERSDPSAAGQLMLASHAGLRDEYQVSCNELDLLVEISAETRGCYGARLTGAGFGGCAIALVERPDAESFMESVQQEYESRTGRKTPFYLCSAAQGASIWGKN